MSPKIPKHIQIQVLADSKPIQGMVCLLTATSKYKNDFNTIVGPSDSNGHIIVSGEDILASANEDANLFLMDYGDPINCITGNFIVTPMTLSKLIAAKDTYKSFNKSYHYPPHHIESIEHAIKLLSESSITELAIRVISIEGYGKVKSVSAKINSRAG
jgi:hypothetical protein